MLAAGGARVGLISSPHLSRINERIVIDGQMISDAYLDDLGLEIKIAALSSKIELSFFEAITMAGFLAFARSELDWGVVEVGLGGRLDATNIITSPKVSVVTTIDLDHQDLLGDSLEKIAAEKAGIFKPNTTVVIGELKPDPQAVLLTKANELDLKSYTAGKDFVWNVRNTEGRVVRYRSEVFGDGELESGFRGAHQAQNLSVAVTAARAAGVSMSDCIRGAATAFWPARLEAAVVEGRNWILDCAHNPAGVQTLATYLSDTGVSDATLIFGALDTKDWKGMLKVLTPFSSEVLIVEPRAPNPVSAEAIAAFLSGNEVRFRVFGDDYQAARSHIREIASPLTIVAGSIYLVGEFRQRLLGEDFNYWAQRSTRSTT